MPFIPHTEDEIQAMLSTLQVDSTEDLFDEIPANIRCDGLPGIPSMLNEQAISRLMSARAAADGQPLSFLGAGAYEHHIPAAVWEIATRGEFYSAYTPYQAEASQGTLQLIYEYQTMMARLMAMDVSNASLYDGASALAEAVLMAVRGHRKSKSKRVLMPRNLHPHYRRATTTLVGNQGIDLQEIAFSATGGHTRIEDLSAYEDEDVTALVIAQPNFFGILEDVDALTDWAHQQGALVIAVVNPLAMALLTPPGEWGEQGADIVCGEGQPLGIPLSSGGPYYGFMCCSKKLVRQMPGRIVGRTVDVDGRDGFTLTLQAREQHIRRSKATSNICTNQGLMVTASTIHMALLGDEGLRRVALASHENTRKLMERLTALDGVEPIFDRPFFHEVALRLSLPLKGLLRPLHAHNLLPGYELEQDYPELKNTLLSCATEVKTDDDIDLYVDHLARIIKRQSGGGCPVPPKMQE
ncbi:MAG: aminomethyl-transferring glycine dehydrogenase subunit GcvPA [Gammaproteobacteria bacterium]|nr:aminomethyl-transferring glycine dehydrogenase subunit GcvPA [Gammaproteobacteria bacterium]